MSGYSGKWSPTVRKAVNAAKRARRAQGERAAPLERERDEDSATQADERAYERWLDELGRNRWDGNPRA